MVTGASASAPDSELNFQHMGCRCVNTRAVSLLTISRRLVISLLGTSYLNYLIVAAVPTVPTIQLFCVLLIFLLFLVQFRSDSFSLLDLFHFVFLLVVCAFASGSVATRTTHNIYLAPSMYLVRLHADFLFQFYFLVY